MGTDAVQPCAACGEETAAGKPRFVGRRTIGDSGTSYLCASCDDLGTTRRGQRLTDDVVRRLVETGAMGVYVWSGYAHLGGGDFHG